MGSDALRKLIAASTRGDAIQETKLLETDQHQLKQNITTSMWQSDEKRSLNQLCKTKHTKLVKVWQLAQHKRVKRSLERASRTQRRRRHDITNTGSQMSKAARKQHISNRDKNKESDVNNLPATNRSNQLSYAQRINIATYFKLQRLDGGREKGADNGHYVQTWH